ncbi:isopentenyl-diphosphate Delta-isomerase [Pedobacter xixiisoli]|uniref:Isopentenyl-diphosphate delta-isomerase n=1 Tax=Pedobacter xixiisoli TaxID=1476464 RepID=A0A285ZQJ6_9SPHI|nr:isopentenyl-diphosphate Delta-isomerase [Pedobacter xixiisoli]SOD11912.1 isopentenyl-diphosphate delta-isomerase [Pedobacter xixiisoli]
MIEEVILVDAEDTEIGLMEKMQAHREAKLHRAFSVFLLNDENEVLLQRRAFKKYHCGGMWTNACCSHPRAGETLQAAVDRRLEEEMGIACETNWVYSFIYKANVGEGLFEHEFDHVFFGRFSGTPKPDENEVSDWAYVTLAELKKDVKVNPDKYTPWFKIILAEVLDKNILDKVI